MPAAYLKPFTYDSYLWDTTLATELHFLVGTKRHKIGTTFEQTSSWVGLFFHVLREQKRNHRILRIPFLSRNSLSIGIKRYANRRVAQQFLHDLQFRSCGSKQRRIGVTKSVPADSLRDS
jgi:hypothetical protein